MKLTLRALFGLDNDTPLAGVSCDSRNVKKNMIFVALPGTVVDGRDYIDAAIDNGAIAVITTGDVKPKGRRKDVVFVNSSEPRLDYAYLASAFYPRRPKVLVAMTGTNGKSSTVEFLRQIWAYAGYKAACFGTLGVSSFNGELPLSHTTPDALVLHETLDGLARAGASHVAMEASSHGLAQYRLDAVMVSAAGFSNLSQDHFDYHGTMENYFKAKSRLFMQLTPKGAPVVINVDDAHGRRLAKLCDKRGLDVMQIGKTAKHIWIVKIIPRASGQDICLEIAGLRYDIALPLAGAFQVYNVVCALGLAIKTGVDIDTAIEALLNLRGVAGRMELAGKTPDGAPIFVDFAHTDDGLEKLLSGLRPHVSGNLNIVFGCGGDRDKGKRAKMGAVAARLADGIIVTDDNPRHENAQKIRDAVMKACPQAENIGGRAKAIARGISQLGPNDALVIAGKGHEKTQIIGSNALPFNDVEEVRKHIKGTRS